MTKTTLSALAVAALLLGTLAGCNPPPDTTTTTSTTTTTTSSSPAMGEAASATTEASGSAAPEAGASASTAASGSPVGGADLTAANGTTVEITETDTDLKMPSALPVGTISFKINNSGKNKHNLEIKGEGVDKKLDAPIDPGAAQVLSVELKAGTYEVTDPDNPTIKSTLTVKQ